MTVLVARTPAELAVPREGAWGLVPTMGALHAGHLALIARAAAENATAVVSVFVNPTQFGRTDDLSRYPRDLDADIAKAAAAGARIIYAPDASTVYPPGFATWVEPGDLALRWEGSSRPGHFRGVATVVAILLNTVRADRAYFGEKDFQQLQIVRRMHQDLQLPGAIVASPTVRDRDGLALSSRNSRLSSEGRATARAIPRALAAIAARAQAGASSAAELLAPGRTILSAPGIDLDYLALVDAETLEPTACLGSSSRVLVAAEVDSVRLIDNIALPARQEQTPDHGRPQPA